MIKSKAKICLILWLILLVVGSVISGYIQLNYSKDPGFIQYIKNFLLLVYSPVLLIPPLGATFYYAVKEKSKTLKVISLCLLFHHILCVVGFAVELFTA